MGRVHPPYKIGEHVSALVKLFIIQLTKGCGNEMCISTSCHTYCTRTADRPYRPWTELSARAIAFELACEPNAVALLCHDSDGNVLLKPPDVGSSNGTFHATRFADKGSIDEKSMSQAIFDTEKVTSFLNDGRVYSRSDRAYLRTMQELDYDFDSFPTRLCKPAEDDLVYSLVYTILSSLHFLFEHIEAQDWPILNIAHHTRQVMFFISDHITMYVGSRLARALKYVYDGVGQQSDHAQIVHELLLQALGCEDISRGAQAPQQHDPHYRNNTTLPNSTLKERVISRRDVLGLGSVNQHSLLFEVITAAFLKSWNGSGNVPVGSPADYALSAMDWLETRFGPIYKSLPHLHSLLADRLDLVRLVRQAMKGNESRLLRHTWLFSSPQQATMFRARRLLNMEAAVDDSNLVSKLQAADVQHLSHEYHLQMQDLGCLQLHDASLTVLHIQGTRHSALTDGFDALWRRDVRELLRPLRVCFDGVLDVGQDAGGVAQEFLQLCWVQAMDPDLGLFTVDEQPRMAWFSSHCFEPTYKYELLGVLFALSLHNGFVLPITFPLVLYKRLLGGTIDTIKDIEDGWPDIARGLKQLRDWVTSAGSVEDIFGLTFDFTVRTLDETVIYDMTTADSAGASIDTETHSPTVTDSNRFNYISCYIQWLTDLSVKPKLSSFIKGFHSLIPLTELTCLTPETLQTLAEGDQAGADFSVDLLRKHTTYGGGYDDRSKAIYSFWKIARTWDITLKRQFLMFVTASDRLPVNGERGLGIEIVRQPLDLAVFAFNAPGRTSEQNEGMGLTVDLPVDEYGRLMYQRSMEKHFRNQIMMAEAPLPTSNTCFARLNLPDYDDEDVLRFKLEKALKLGWLGFGLA